MHIFRGHGRPILLGPPGPQDLGGGRGAGGGEGAGVCRGLGQFCAKHVMLRNWQAIGRQDLQGTEKRKDGGRHGPRAPALGVCVALE